MPRTVMLRFATVLVLMILCSPASAQRDKDLTALISRLAVLTNIGEGCGEQLNYFGKKALTSEQCNRFVSEFQRSWPDRESLRKQVADYFQRMESGEFSCDEDCQIVLQRVEELRITVTYYLDYMEFMAEL